MRTLLLDLSGQPHAVLSWEDAICLVYQNKVFILEEYAETVSSPSVTYFVPAVIQLKKANLAPKRNPRFSRLGVYSRDDFKCQYCGAVKPWRELNLDHVNPKKYGGGTTWTNVVACCYSCNTRKGCKTPEQAGMALMRKPARPNSLPLHAVFFDSLDPPEAWRPYLGSARIQLFGSGHYLVVPA